MCDKEPLERPDCKELLEKKIVWAFGAQELPKNTQIYLLNNIISIAKYESFTLKLLNKRYFIDRFVYNGKFKNDFIINQTIGSESNREVFEVSEKYKSKKIFAIKRNEVSEIN